MRTKIFKYNQIDEAVRFLKQGEVVAVPTETVYGLAADAKNEGAIQKIFEVKDRPRHHPLILHIASYEQLDDWAEDLSMDARRLAAHFWPGPLTMVLAKKPHVSDMITGGLSTIAIRVPQHPLTREVIHRLGHGIVAPSANAHKKTSPTQVAHVLKTLDGKIPAILDGGMSSIGIESTIIDMSQDMPVMLRYGVVTQDMIEHVLQREISCPSHHHERISGNMEQHYQPERPLFLLSTEEIQALSSQGATSAIMHYSHLSKKDGFIYYPMSAHKEEYAKHLYSALHEIDGLGVDKIWVEEPPKGREWRDIRDRLLRASAK